jgi:hypothetical protein
MTTVCTRHRVVVLQQASGGSMDARILGRFVVAVLLAVIVTAPQSGHALVVNAGFDLLHAPDGTSFEGLTLSGVAIGSFDFGGTIHTRNTGNADTIFQRLGAVTVPDSPLPQSAGVDVKLVALQLVTTTEINLLGFGLDFYYVTLQSVRGGPASLGTYDITFNNADGGVFDAAFDVALDVRKGSLSGPIVLSDNVHVTDTANPWQREPALDELLIQGVNYKLNGTDISTDFQPPSIAVPEPSALVFVVGGIAAFGFVRRKFAG